MTYISLCEMYLTVFLDAVSNAGLHYAFCDVSNDARLVLMREK